MGEFKLTLAQLASSLLGYGGIGVAIACFVPLIRSSSRLLLAENYPESVPAHASLEFLSLERC